MADGEISYQSATRDVIVSASKTIGKEGSIKSVLVRAVLRQHDETACGWRVHVDELCASVHTGETALPVQNV